MKHKKETLLEIHNLSISFRMYAQGLEQKELKVISDLDLTVYPGAMISPGYTVKSLQLQGLPDLEKVC